MRHKLPSRRKIGLYVAVFFLGIAGVCFLLLRINSVYFWHKQRFNCLVALSVDLSAPGTYAASFDHWRWIDSFAVMGLDVPGKVLAETPPAELLAGLQGTYSIRDATGGRVFWGALLEEPNNVPASDFPGIIQLRRFPACYGDMKWQIDVIVTKGAPLLKSVPQRLVLVDKRSSFGPATVLMWFSLIVAVIIVMGVEGARYQSKKRLKNGKKPADTG